MTVERLYNVTEAAEILAIPASTLARKATRNQAPHRRVVSVDARRLPRRHT